MADAQDNSPTRHRRRDVLRRRPWLSAAILAGGAIVYWLLCWPAVSASVFTPVDPFWGFMRWLWPIPVLLSAICENRRWTRTWQLLLYALAVGYVFRITFHSPLYLLLYRPTLATCMQRTAVGGGIVFAAAWCLEQVAQYSLRFVRGFETQGLCQRCGYCILHLPEPRCPECGRPFDPEHATSALTSRESARPRRTQIVAIALILAGASTPFVLQAISNGVAAAQGRAAAKNDWAADCPLFHIDRSATPWLTSNTYDVDTGMLLRSFGAGLRTKPFEEAYHAAILKQLARYGPPPRRPDVLDREQIKALLASGRFVDVSEDHFHLNNVLITRYSFDPMWPIKGRPDAPPGWFEIGSFGCPVSCAYSDDASGVAYLLLKDTLLVSFAPDGSVLQQVALDQDGVADHPPIWPPPPAP
ncbi:MAG: hypothetical protein PVJ57_08365 [Phycisphaerae bacterium]|jgi:hypothetical protein